MPLAVLLGQLNNGQAMLVLEPRLKDISAVILLLSYTYEIIPRYLEDLFPGRFTPSWPDHIAHITAPLSRTPLLDLIMARDKVEDEELSHHEKNDSSCSPSSSQEFAHDGEKRDIGRRQSTLNMKLKNPLAGMSYDELMADMEQFAKKYDLEYGLDDLRKAP